MVLIINKNKPKVTIVIGKVRNIIIGPINTFSKPKTIATVKAAFRLVTVTPFNKPDIANIDTAVNINFNIIFIAVFYKLLRKLCQLYFMQF